MRHRQVDHSIARRSAALVAVGTMALGCAPDQPVPDDSSSASILIPTTTVASPPASPPASTPASTPASVLSGSERVDLAGTIELVELARFERPVDLVARPGDDALYVVQQRGTIVRWTIDDGGRTTALDVTASISDGGEQGLLGLAFSTDGRHAFVNTTARDGSTTITEYRVADDGRLDESSGAVVLIVPQPYRNHNAGDLAVDAEGMLYIALGDGGSANDPERTAHDPSTLLGSLLRIEPLLDGSGGYRIPPDNPFADGPVTLPDGATVNGAAEVFAWGLRNPWKFAIDPLTGDLWIPDVGQNEVEEINMVPSADGRPAGAGHDFGWSAFEGTERFNLDVPETGRSTPPVLTYRHGPDGCSISGGEPYRGNDIPGLSGAFVHSDYCSGRLWALDLGIGRHILLADGLSEVTAVRADDAGELYVLEAGGRILRLSAGRP